MNYRHAFHAGGFADVIKHIVLVRMLTYLQESRRRFASSTPMPAPGAMISPAKKRAARRMADRHRRVMQARFSENALPLVTPYLDIVRASTRRASSRPIPDRP